MSAETKESDAPGAAPRKLSLFASAAMLVSALRSLPDNPIFRRERACTLRQPGYLLIAIAAVALPTLLFLAHAWIVGAMNRAMGLGPLPVTLVTVSLFSAAINLPRPLLQGLLVWFTFSRQVRSGWEEIRQTPLAPAALVAGISAIPILLLTLGEGIRGWLGDHSITAREIELHHVERALLEISWRLGRFVHQLPSVMLTTFLFLDALVRHSLPKAAAWSALALILISLVKTIPTSLAVLAVSRVGDAELINWLSNPLIADGPDYPLGVRMLLLAFLVSPYSLLNALMDCCLVLYFWRRALLAVEREADDPAPWLRNSG